MAKAAVATPAVEFEAIDRLEQKRQPRGTGLARPRAPDARAADDNARLRAELDAARGRIAEAEGVGTELAAMRQEREQIRGRVDDMLKQIEALNL